MKSLFIRIATRLRTWNKWDVIALILGGSTFSILSLFNMGRWSIWFDEAFGLFLIRSSYWDVARLTSLDVHPPMYYWLLKAWTGVFGVGNEIAVRSLSLVLMLIAILFIYLLVRKLFGQKAAVISLGLLAIAPLLLRYSEEARMYGMTTAIVAAATYVLVSAMQNPRRWKWVVYGLLVALGLWTHYLTAVAFIAHWAWRYVALRQHNKKSEMMRAFFDKGWIMAHVIAFVAYIPWVYFAVKQLVTIQGGGFWISPIGPSSALNFVSDTLMYRVAGEASGWFAALLWVIVASLIVLAFRVYRGLSKEKRTYYWLFIIMALVPLGLMIIASLPPLRPALVDRYIMFAAAFLVALIGVTLAHTIGTRRRPGRLGLVTGVLVVIAMVSGIFYLYQIGNFNKDGNDPLPIRPTMEIVWSETKPNEPTLVSSITRYYEVAFYENRAPQGTKVYFEAADNLNWGSYEPIRHSPQKVVDSAAFARSHGGTIWYVGDWADVGKPALPKQGSWTVLREIHAASLPDGKSDIRAVELQLNN